MSEPSVFRFASVVVCVLLSGSSSTLPHPPVTGSTRFGAFPAAIRSPSGLPEIDSPSMNRAAVNAEATVVSSLITTFSGGLLPSTNNRTIAGLSALPFTTPPLETRYRIDSAAAAPRISNFPSSFVFVSDNFFGAFALASHSVTVALATGAPATLTCPLRWSATSAELDGMREANDNTATNVKRVQMGAVICTSIKVG